MNPGITRQLGALKQALPPGLKAIETGIQINDRKNPYNLAILTCAYAIAGRISEARKFFSEFEALARNTYVPAMSFAISYLSLGDIEKGFDWLEKSIDEREWTVMEFLGMSIFDPLRSHPRYRMLLGKMNLKP